MREAREAKVGKIKAEKFGSIKNDKGQGNGDLDTALVWNLGVNCY